MKRLLSWFERQKYRTNTGEVRLPPVLTGQFTPQNRLEELLIEAGYDPEAESAFENWLLDNEVLVAIRDDGQPNGMLENAGELGVYTLTAEDGESYPVGFTAQDRGYECFGPGTVMAKLAGRQMLEMASGVGIWLNPSSSFGVLWKAIDVKRILEG
jgi:hypothetical protein